MNLDNSNTQDINPNQILEDNFRCQPGTFVYQLEQRYFDYRLFTEVLNAINMIEFSKEVAWKVRFVESRIMTCFMASFDPDDQGGVDDIDEIDISNILEHLEGVIAKFYH